MLQAFQAPGRFWKGNIHGHSDRSDGLATPQEACERYKRAGYDFIALTDHFLEIYDFPLTDTRPFRDAHFTTIIGAELHAPKTSRDEIWHVLAVGLPFDFAPTAEDETGPELARRARDAGAFVAIAHPHWYQLQKQDGLALDAAHAVEAYNHTSHIHCDRGDGLVLLDALLSEGRRLATIAVDDSHWKNGDAFGGWVVVKAEENTPEALLAALRDGAFYSSQGPEIADIRIDKDELVVVTSPVESVMALGPVARSRQKLAAGEGGPLTETRLPLEPFQGHWCRIAVRDANGRRAWSNPLWLD